MAFSVEVRGLRGLQVVRQLNDRKRRAASRAINQTTRDERAIISRQISREIALPRSLLGPRQGRLTVSRKASPSSLEGRITARGRPTSLARFIRGTPRRGAGVALEVKPGRLTRIRRAFPIRLRRGSALTDTKFNLGLAIRLRRGETIDNKRKFIQLGPGLYLLYGPSVQQAFLDNEGRGAARDRERPAADRLQSNFLRILGL